VTAPGGPPSERRFEFRAHAMKLRLLSWLVGGLAALLIWYAATAAPSPAAVLPVVVLLLAGAVTAGRLASDPRPVLAVDAEGLEDRLHGRIPWRDVAWYRAQGGITPGFGWALKKGVQPPRNRNIYRVQAVLNALSGLPPRSYRRKLLLATPQEMAEACRAHRPELER